ncbi:MAG: DUF167 domain-containing protein [Patescibacteria group bacterium]|jgi:hypothetical protein
MIINVHVTPRAKRNEVSAVDATHFKIKVTVVAEKGKANAKVITFLAEHLGVAKSCLEIIKGETSRDKVVRVI